MHAGLPRESLFLKGAIIGIIQETFFDIRLCSDNLSPSTVRGCGLYPCERQCNRLRVCGEVLKQKPIEITIRYKGYIHPRETTCNIDFDEFQGMEVVGEPSLDKMAKSIEKIQKDLSGLMKKL